MKIFGQAKKRLLWVLDFQCLIIVDLKIRLFPVAKEAVCLGKGVGEVEVGNRGKPPNHPMFFFGFSMKKFTSIWGSFLTPPYFWLFVPLLNFKTLLGTNPNIPNQGGLEDDEPFTIGGICDRALEGKGFYVFVRWCLKISRNHPPLWMLSSKRSYSKHPIRVWCKLLEIYVFILYIYIYIYLYVYIRTYLVLRLCLQTTPHISIVFFRASLQNNVPKTSKTVLLSDQRRFHRFLGSCLPSDAVGFATVWVDLQRCITISLGVSRVSTKGIQSKFLQSTLLPVNFA